MRMWHFLAQRGEFWISNWQLKHFTCHWSQVQSVFNDLKATITYCLVLLVLRDTDTICREREATMVLELHKRFILLQFHHSDPTSKHTISTTPMNLSSQRKFQLHDLVVACRTVDKRHHHFNLSHGLCWLQSNKECQPVTMNQGDVSTLINQWCALFQKEASSFPEISVFQRTAAFHRYFPTYAHPIQRFLCPDYVRLATEQPMSSPRLTQAPPAAHLTQLSVCW